MKAMKKRTRRREVVEYVERRDRVCQAVGRIDNALNPRLDMSAMDSVRDDLLATNPPRACGGKLDVHEVIPRSAWAAGQYEESNCLLVCRRHHDWIDDNPEMAHVLGLHGFSWERA